jgi:hypothetical protein
VLFRSFIDERDPSSNSRLRDGRIIGGGKTAEDRPLRLVLNNPDYALVRRIQDAVNTKFKFTPAVANARSPSFIDIRIPREYRDQYERFCTLIMHIYLAQGAGVEESRARELAKEMLLPTAPHDDISLVWEAMGKQVIPCFRDLYSSEDPAAAYYAARAGMRLGDPQAMEVVVRTAGASSAGSPFRLDAIAELGLNRTLGAAQALRALLDSPDAVVRVAAYEAMCKIGATSGLRRTDVAGQFILDVLPSRGNFLIYATRTEQPRIAVFGQNVEVARPVFCNSPDGDVTVHAEAGEDQLKVYRHVGAKKVLSDEQLVKPDVESLVLALGSEPEKDNAGKYRGLGLSYSQVVGVIYRLCKDDNGKPVPAEFILQKPGKQDTIGTGVTPVGRPDSTTTRP